MPQTPRATGTPHPSAVGSRQEQPLRPPSPFGDRPPLDAEVRMRRRRVPARSFAGAILDNVVVPVEGTDREFLAQQWAAQVAAALGIPLRGLHVATPGRLVRIDLFEYLQAECERWDVPFVSETVEGNDIAGELAAELRPRDLAVIGTRRLKSKFHVGSVAKELVRRAPCPVLVVRLA